VRRTHPLQRFGWSSNTEHPHLTQQARALVPVGAQDDVVPWERLRVPDEVNGSRGAFRVPKATCTLDANNAYEAVQAWLALHKSSATQRAYRKEAERLIPWAVVERGRALSAHRCCQSRRFNMCLGESHSGFAPPPGE
jgi:hypothetical protein